MASVLGVPKREHLAILRSWPIHEVKIKSVEKQRPSHLPRVQPFGVPQVLQIVVVCQDHKRGYSAFQAMATHLQREHNH